MNGTRSHASSYGKSPGVKLTLTDAADHPTARPKQMSTGSGQPLRGFGRLGQVLKHPPKVREHLKGHREDNGRVLFGANLHQRLQVAELDSGGLFLDQLSSHCEFFSGRVLALSVNDFSAALTL